ncbi:MAG: MATE family efflux transporter [Candidatus Caldatribacterium sp.]|nr:MATE family efflux transporter [Candidatus Caldatribacterium sp.]
MQQGRVTDFTQGSIPRHLIVFSIPMLIGNLLQTLYNTVDSIWVGRFLGPEALAAVSVSFPIVFLLVAFTIGLSMAASVMVAQYFGAKKEEEVRRTATASTALLTLLGLGLMVLGLFVHESLLHLIRTPSGIMELAASYLFFFLLGLPFMFLYNNIGSILRGVGDSKTPLVLLVYATILNIILDPLLILGVPPFPRLGVAGAAIATTVSQGFSAIWGTVILRRGGFFVFEKDYLVPCASFVRTLFRLGLPAGAQQTIVSLGHLTMMAIVNGFGKTVVAAFGAAARVDQFSFLPAMSFSIAISSLAGQNVGAQNFTRAREVARWGAIVAGGFALPISAFVFAFAPQLIRIFTTDPEVTRIGIEYLRIVSPSYVPFALMFAYNGFLRGAGDTFQTMVNTLLTLWLVRIPVAKLLSMTSLAERGIWMSFVAGPVAGYLIAYLYYLSGKWEAKSLIRKERESFQEAAC